MSDKQKILVLGAGLVAGPLVRYLTKQGYHVAVGCRTLPKAQALIEGEPSACALATDVTDQEALSALIADYDLVVSLVPATSHLAVAQACLKHNKHMVTSSYISDEMAALDPYAKKAGLIFLNEMGLDPGIDHMSAMEIIDKVKDKGGRITGFASNCGGLPAPEANNNPLGYKFSWSPRGVLLASRNSARYLKNGRETAIPSRDLFTQCRPLSINGLGDFEFYPNRDCLKYIDLYGLEGIRDMFRGTIRYEGWCRFMKTLVDMGYLDIDPRSDIAGATYAAITASLIGATTDDLDQTLPSFLRLDSDDAVIEKMNWLGLMSKKSVPEGLDTPLDALVALLMEKMPYKKGERDMIILQHRFEVEYADKKSRITSTLIDYGDPEGDSAMARTVGLPAAIGADLILRNEIRLRGVLAPVKKQIYQSALSALEKLGLHFDEKEEPTD